MRALAAALGREMREARRKLDALLREVGRLRERGAADFDALRRRCSAIRAREGTIPTSTRWLPAAATPAL